MADYFDDGTDGRTVEDHGVKCPHCGHVRTDDLYDYNEGERYEMECGYCEQPYTMRLYVTHTYIAEKVTKVESVNAVSVLPHSEERR